MNGEEKYRNLKESLKSMENALHRRADELATLQAVSLEITAAQDLPALLQMIIEQAVRLLKGSGGGFYLCDPEHQQVRCAVSYHTVHDYAGVVLKYGEGIAGKVAQSGKPIIIDDYRTWPGHAAVFTDDRPFRSVISAPVIWQGQVTGILHVLDSELRRFTAEELDLLTLFASQAAIAIEYTRLLESERRRSQESETLRQVTTALTSTLSLDVVLDNLLTHLKQVVDHDSATVFLLEEGRLHAKAARGLLHPELVLGKNFPANDPLFLQIQQSGQPLILEDAQLEPRFNQWGGTDYIHSWMGIPMTVYDKVIGYLTCDHQQPGIYQPKDAILAQAFANQAAIAIENARLFEAERSQLLLSQTLQKVGTLLTSQLGLQEVLENLLDLLRRVISYNSASIHLLNDEGTLYLAAGRGFEDAEQAQQIVREKSGYMMESKWAEPRLIVIPDTSKDDRWLNIPGAEYIHSWIGAPLVVRGSFIGSLNVDSKSVYAYNAAIGETTLAFANQASIAIENARLFEAEKKRVAELEAVRQASISLTSSLELPQVLNAILRSALALLPEAQNAHIFLYNSEEGGKLTFGAALWKKDVLNTPWREPRPQGLTYTVARQGKTIMIPDMSKHPIYANVPSYWSGAIVGLPLKIGPQVIGVMNVSFHQARQIPEAELRMLQLLGDQAAIAIENARLFEQAATERRHLSLIYDISREVSSSLDPNEILTRAIYLTSKALDSFMGEAFLYIPDEDRLSLRALYGLPEGSLSRVDTILNMRPGKGLVGWVAQNLQAVYLADVAQDPRWWHAPGIDDDIRSSLSAPILADSHLMGVLIVFDRKLAAFKTEHLELLQAICREVGLALSNAQRYQQAQRRLTEITLIQNLVQTFNRRLEVQKLLEEVATQLSQQLGYSEIMIFIVEQDELVLKATVGSIPEQKRFPLSRGIIGRVARTGQAALVPDVSLDPDYYHCIRDNQAELAVPIFQGENVVGIISIQSERANQLAVQDRNLLQMLAGQISVALENALLYEQVRSHAEDLERIVTQRTAELTELYKLSQEIGYAISFEDLLRLLLDHLRNAIRSEFVAGALAMDDRHSLLVESERIISPSIASQLRSLWLEELRQHRESIPSEDQLRFEIACFDGKEAAQPAIGEIASLIQAPIFIEQRLVGLLAAGSERALAFSPAQERLLTTFANQASAAAQHLYIILATQHRQLASLVEHLPVGVLLLDSDLHVLVANSMGREMLSMLNTDTAQGSPLKRLGAYAIHTLIDQQSYPLPVEISVESTPRRIFAVQIRPTEPSPEEGHQWVLTLNDITQERENIAHIQTQERLATVGQLAAGIAHDFNNIMAAILVYTDLLRYDSSISSAAQDKLVVIQQQIQRASSLIRQILDFSRRSVMEQSALDILPLIKELEKMLTRILPETIHLQLNYQPGSYWINGDPARLQQVFMNLTLNARDAMPTGGMLRFELDTIQLQPGMTPPLLDLPPGAWIRIVVADTGTGISSEISQHIFEPFFTTKPIGQGTGLGLAQVYGIVKQHDGYIDVQSQAGKGTSFIVYLPALEIQRDYDSQHETPIPLQGEGQTVLIVEDDQATREALQTLLETQGYDVLTASNGNEALQRLEQSLESIPLVISDLVMPQMGGIALYHIIQEKRPETKMLLITGHPLDRENLALLETGSIHWLQKPFSVQKLNQTINDLLYGEST